MIQDELKISLIGKDVFSTKYSNGKIKDVTFSNNDIYLSIDFENSNENNKTFSANIALNKDILIFKDNYLKEVILSYLKSIQQSNIRQSNSISTSIEKTINISKREDINVLVKNVLENKSIALELIKKYGDNDFESTLLKETFDKMSKIIKGDSITKVYKAQVLVAMSYIALKYYDGDLHHQIILLYKKYAGNESDSSIINVYYKCLCDYKPVFKYFDKKSYNAVPIIACAVPHDRLNDLYFIAYDIYKKKLLFDEDVLDDQIETKVSESLLNLRNKGLIDSSTKENDKIKGTEYLMSKYTQSIIYTGVCFNDLVKIITKCIRYIILHLTRKEDAFDVDYYYYEAYNDWTSKFDNNSKEKSKYEKTKLLSRPYFALKNRNEVVLNTGEFCMDDSYDPNNVSIEIYENEELKDTIALNGPNDIVFNDDGAMSGYIINRKSILINCSPINKLSYEIKCFEKEIYNSKNRLYRKVLFFNGDGKEIKPGTDYDGQLFTITKYDNREEYEDNIIQIYKTDSYFISILNVNSNEIFRLDNEPFIFAKISDARMTGYIVPWANFISMENKKYEIYKDTSFLFEAPCDKEDIYIEIDDNKICYGEESIINYSIYLYSNDYKGTFIYKILLYNLDSGYHKLKIYNGKSNRLLKNCVFDFVCDSTLSRVFVKKISTGIKYNLLTNFIKEPKELDWAYGTTIISLDSFVKGLGYGKLNIFPSTISISLDNSVWNDLDRKLYLCDVLNNKVYITGPENLKAICVLEEDSIKKRILNLNPISDNPFKYVLHTDYLMSIKDRKNIKIEFQYGSTKKYCKAWYNPYIKTDECKIIFNDENKTLFLNIKYESNAKLYIRVFTFKENRELYLKKIQSDENNIFDLAGVDKSIEYIQVSLHAINEKSIFEKYIKEPIITFKKINISGDKFMWVQDPLNSFKYDLIKKKILGNFNFEGCIKIKLKLYPSGFKYILDTCDVKSNEPFEFNISNYIFNSYNILIYKFNDKENKYEENPVYITKPIKTDSKFLNMIYKIKEYILVDDKNVTSENSIKFNRLKEINGKLYLICSFLGKMGNVIMEDVLVSVDNNFMIGLKLKIFKLENKQIKRIKHKNGKIINYITLIY